MLNLVLFSEKLLPCLSECLGTAVEEAGKPVLWSPGLEGSKYKDTCLSLFPSILTVFQRLLLNPGCQEKSGKLHRDSGHTERLFAKPHTLVT